MKCEFFGCDNEVCLQGFPPVGVGLHLCMKHDDEFCFFVRINDAHGLIHWLRRCWNIKNITCVICGRVGSWATDNWHAVDVDEHGRFYACPDHFVDGVTVGFGMLVKGVGGDDGE